MEIQASRDRQRRKEGRQIDETRSTVQSRRTWVSESQLSDRPVDLEHNRLDIT